jgi:hypothetical protein
VADFDEYKDWLTSLDTQFVPFLLRQNVKVTLERIQNDFFRTATEKMKEPRPMKEILNEFIDKHGLLPGGDKAGDVHPGLKALVKFQGIQTLEALKNGGR